MRRLYYISYTFIQLSPLEWFVQCCASFPFRSSRHSSEDSRDRLYAAQIGQGVARGLVIEDSIPFICESFQSLEDLCSQYDVTVRNSDGLIVQFKYGGDGLDPAVMEGKDKPVDFFRVMQHVKVSPSPAAWWSCSWWLCPEQAKFRCEEEVPLSPSQLEFLCARSFKTDQFKFCNEEFKKEMKYSRSQG